VGGEPGFVIAHNPFTGRMAARAEQFGAPARTAGRLRVPWRRLRRRCYGPPAHPCRRKLRLRLKPHQPQRGAMLFSRQAKPARGGEIQRARIACNLSDYAGEIPASEPLFKRKQSIFGRCRLDMDQPLAPVARQAMQVGPPAKPDRACILHPQHMAAIIHLCQRIISAGCHLQGITRQRHGQPRPACIACACENLAMQRLIGKPRPPARLPPQR